MWGASWSLLPTATTIVAVGLSVVVGGAGGSAAAHFFAVLDGLIAPLVAPLVMHLAAPQALHLRAGLGAGLGYLVSWGSEQGYYHTILLPLIAVAMQVRPCLAP